MFRLWGSWLAASLILASLPTSTHYQLNSFGFGNGGAANDTSSTYAVEGITGEVNGTTATGSAYKTKPGFIQTQQANVPQAPTFTNPANYYDKLQLIIAPSGNPSDAKFAIAISSDNFGSDNRFVKADHTVGSTLTLADYQTYSSWGSGSGFNVIGLAANTTYTVKVKATQGKFTESAYGPTASASTVGQQLSFSVSPNSEALGTLTAGSVIASPSNVTASLGTNADAGASVYITGANGGLKSTQDGFTISSATADLSSATAGFGVQDVSVGQSSGGPLTVLAPFNGSSQNVGQVNTALAQIFQTTAPITGGSGVFVIKAKASNVTPAASDYAETLTVVAAAAF